MSSENFLTSSKPSTSEILRLGSTSLYFCAGEVGEMGTCSLVHDYGRPPYSQLVHSHL